METWRRRNVHNGRSTSRQLSIGRCERQAGVDGRMASWVSEDAWRKERKPARLAPPPPPATKPAPSMHRQRVPDMTRTSSLRRLMEHRSAVATSTCVAPLCRPHLSASHTGPTAAPLLANVPRWQANPSPPHSPAAPAAATTANPVPRVLSRCSLRLAISTACCFGHRRWRARPAMIQSRR